MYNPSIVRQLCTDILNEEDPDKVEELISLLQAIIRDDQEEVRTRISFLGKKYPNVISDSKAAD
jgi:signal transduction histidine kinase